MLELILFIAFIYFVIVYWPIAVAILLFLIFFIIYSVVKSKRNKNYVIYDMPTDKNSPKIGAAVSEAMYEDVNDYCRRHRMTVSDLIRKSVCDYMKSHP